MSFFSHISGFFPFGRGVEASNTTKGACVADETVPFESGGCAVEKIAECADRARRVLDAVGDESLLVRADLQLALYRLFLWMGESGENSELKDMVASVQKLASLKDALSPKGEEIAARGGLSPVALEEIESELKMM